MNKNLSYGLNITRKQPTQARSLAQKPRASAFGDDSDSEVEDPTKTRHKPASSPTKRKPVSNVNLVKSTSSTKAEEVDPSIYDYDGAWEDIKQVERKKKEADVEDAAQRKPKYMGQLLAAAEVRKRDQLRAKDRMLMKEREQEGEEFADKEKFVTAAYKEQQEEMRRLEEEERKKEEDMAKNSKGMSSFYRNMLDRTEQQHGDILAASSNTKKKPQNPHTESEPPKEKSEADIAREINKERAGAVDINDEGLVVDKRQLLGAGLNVSSKKKDEPKSNLPQNTHIRSQPKQFLANKMASRQRQSQIIAQQLEDAHKRAQDEEKASVDAAERLAKVRKTTKEDVMSARDRYLKRKEEAAAAAGKS